MSFIIAGIHTNVGKTIASAVIAEIMDWRYWKPVQTGPASDHDSRFVADVLFNSPGRILPEVYIFQEPASPHYAAQLEGKTVDMENIKFPTENDIIIETAGGVMTPLNDMHTNLDLIKASGLPVILVTSDYLGSINHTLLTIEILKMHQVEIAGLVFSGEEVPSTRSYIKQYSGLPVLLEIPHFSANNLPKDLKGFAAAFENEFINRICAYL